MQSTVKLHHIYEYDHADGTTHSAEVEATLHEGWNATRHDPGMKAHVEITSVTPPLPASHDEHIRQEILEKTSDLLG